MQISTAAVGNNLVVPQKAKHRIPYDAEIPLLGIYLKEPGKKSAKTRIGTEVFTAAPLTIVKKCK